MSALSKKMILLCLLFGPSWAQAMGEGNQGPLPPDQLLTLSKLRQFCGACHALGTQRFLYDDDSFTWQLLFNDLAPESREIWASRIVKVLTWPGEAPPAPSDLMDPSLNLDWMPRGIKRPQIANDRSNGIGTRAFLINQLSR